jgi:DNA-binding MarR family transcriptional regulator
VKIEAYLKESPLFSLYVAHDQVLRDFQLKLAREEVHFIQALIVTGLFFEDQPVRPSALAEILCCSRSNISHAVRDLERRGWVERGMKKDDARAYLLTLTRGGKRQAARLIKILDATQDLLEDVGGKELNSKLRTFVREYRSRLVLPR